MAVVKLAAILAIFCLAGAVAWFAGEAHYDNCVTAAKARVSGIAANDNPFTPQQEFDRFTGKAQQRQVAIDGCSRLPW